ncbi:MAG: hypothetical protein KDA81_21660 [Planctomycetaceae bacterium]|nr:hypothetical protein [Planctomycetaceae bacterium]
MFLGTAGSRNLTRFGVTVSVSLAVLLAITGCGSGSDQPELGLVSGTITFDGNPLSGVAVTFVPDGGRPAMGKTDADGKYELTYIRDTPGCKVGHNKVQIGNTEESEDEAEREGDDYVQKPTKSGPATIPARYNTQTELQAEVKPGENTFDFSLTSK